MAVVQTPATIIAAPAAHLLGLIMALSSVAAEAFNNPHLT